MKKLLLLLLTLLPLAGAFADEEPLPPDQAFALSGSVADSQTVRLTWTVADGYYMYRSKFAFATDTPGVSLGEPKFPPGKVKHDEFFGDIEVYRHSVVVELPVKRTDSSAALKVHIKATSQGCADMGICYPPHHQSVELTLPAVAQNTAPAPATTKPAFDAFGGNDAGDDTVLEPDQAFALQAPDVSADSIELHWQIAPKHYLYRGKFAFEVSGQGVTLDKAELPPGEEKHDEFLGDERIFHDTAQATLHLKRTGTAATAATVKVTYQGCAEAGICYPPIHKTLDVKLPAPGATAAATPGATAALAPAATAPLSEQDSLARSLASGNTFFALLAFFGLGLLLAFTPCVFPMIPILSSIIVGQGEAITTRKAFTLSSVYVLAMAATYTVAGVVAALLGANVQAAFQNPWVLGSFSAVFVALALSMFGFYELQLPSALQSKLTEVSNRQQGGSLVGVAIMGLLSALIVGPCVAPPLMGALIYISQTGDPWLGGAALFALSLGMGAPLVVIGTAGGKFLPRAGGWMDAVKAVFGVLLLAVAVWMLERILPDWVSMLLWALLAVVSAVYMGALEPVREGGSGWRKLWKGLGLILLIQGALILIGASLGSSDPLQPLLRAGSFTGAGPAAAPMHVSFKRVANIAELEREVAAAKAAGRPVMLDFYADWCVSCKEFDKYTFSNPAVLNALGNALTLQADVTANSEAEQALLKRFGLIGPPGIIFYNRNGEEQRNSRVVGFMQPEQFAAHIRQAFGR